MKKILFLILVISLVAMFTGCLPGDTDYVDDPAGFFWGVWHGWVAPLSLFISFFSDTTRLYEINNIGFWYDFGFYIAIIGGLGTLSLSRKKRKKDK
jgi:hypothetical protein